MAQVGHIGYQSQRVTGIVVGEAELPYMTIELSHHEGEKNKEEKEKRRSEVENGEKLSVSILEHLNRINLKSQFVTSSLNCYNL